MHKNIDIKNLDLKEIYQLMISGVSPRPIAFVGTQDQVPQEIYDQMPERVRRKVQKVKPTKQKWKERPKGFVTYE